MTPPLVSVCIPTYRGAAFLAAAIDSVLQQSSADLELWIIDDNSPDDTAAIVAGYTDPRIRYLRNASNLGPEGNWNRCLEVARGKYFKLLPHDDVLAPTCLAEQVAVLAADLQSRIALVFGAREIIDPAGRILMRRGLPRTPASRVDGTGLMKRCVRAGANLIGEPGNALFRRDLISRVGTYDARYPYLVDLDYWFRILLHGDAYYTATHSSSFRICPGSWSVAIGGNQHRDFRGFIDKIRADDRFRISHTDRLIGMAKARVNTVARALMYHYLFSGKPA